MTARGISILMADDDADDREMTREALAENHLSNDIHFVEDGVQLMDYLKRRGKFANPPDSPRPGLILRTGNAGALAILVDGKPAPALGAVGTLRRNVALEPEALLAGTAVKG